MRDDERRETESYEPPMGEILGPVAEVTAFPKGPADDGTGSGASGVPS